MGIRASIATWALKKARGLGRSLGCELVVEPSDHSIELEMSVPDTDKRAWDDNLYQSGGIFPKDQANPVKILVERNAGLENPNEVRVEDPVADGGETVDGDEEDRHVKAISSSRYQEYMRQDLISQILNPREQWRLIFFAVLGVALLGVINMMLGLSAAGVL